MSRVSVRSLALFGAAFWIALQNSGMGLPAARASCGDYVHLGAGAGSETRQIPTANSRAAYQEFPAQRHSPGNEPCDGPGCRQQAPGPGLPLSIPVPNIQHQAACLVESAGWDVRESGRWISEPDRPRCGPGSGRIERPPRNCS